MALNVVCLAALFLLPALSYPVHFAFAVVIPRLLCCCLCILSAFHGFVSSPSNPFCLLDATPFVVPSARHYLPELNQMKMKTLSALCYFWRDIWFG